MGESQALTTEKWGVSRAEQDELAYLSHRNLAKAWDEGFFDDLVTPTCGSPRTRSCDPRRPSRRSRSCAPCSARATRPR
nr:hypothetical protein [Tessaracoccus coleopterorum]